jgi:ABC-2 type transport system permease protein
MSAVNIAEELGVALPDHAEATTHPTRPFLWSIRRELWDSPTILGAPAAIASISILAILFTVIRFSGQFLSQIGPDNSALSNLAVVPLLPVPFVLGVAMVGVAIFYSLDALLSERQERTTLFWKSLPVSDTTTVLAKMAVPIVVLPVVTFVLAVASEVVVFIIGIVALLSHHASVSVALSGIPVLSLLGRMAYTVAAVTLWYAPIYAWCLLVSAWARRAALLWAIVPFFVLVFFEKIAFQTHHVRDFIHDRFWGVFSVSFTPRYTTYSNNHGLVIYTTSDPLRGLWTPSHFLATPALWGGLLFAALAIVLIIRLRRSSGPI